MTALEKGGKILSEGRSGRALGMFASALLFFTLDLLNTGPFICFFALALLVFAPPPFFR